MSLLEEPFSDQEIKEVVWRYEGSKSSGPNGYNFVFIKICWNIIKEDIIRFVKDFHSKARFSKAITSSFLNLVPKNSNPQGLDDTNIYIWWVVYTRSYLNYYLLG